MKKQSAQSLLTKFFYKGNHLYFQILIQTEDDLVMFGEYSDYSVYKTAFDMIQFSLKNETRIINLLEKKPTLENTFANVA